MRETHGSKYFVRGSTVTVVSAMLALALAGCFSSPVDKILKDVTAEISESSKEYTSDSAEAAKEAAEAIIEGATGGDTQLKFGSVPDEFPQDIPLVSENVLQSVVQENGMTVMVSDTRSVQELMPQIRSDFAAWDEEVASALETETVGAMIFSKADGSRVVVNIMGKDGETTVGYTVIGMKK